MRTFRFLAGLVLMFLMASAWATERRFPVAAKRATMTFVQGREVAVNGQMRRLSPGHHIWNQQNRLERPTNLVGIKVPVNYTMDRHGNVDRVWILTDKEIAQTPEEQSITPIEIQVK
ncbi:MAG: hypothetical protein HYS18_10215 [Burkholderiales bacterium]|nr:hypothetical protein [Burkholderiales bacterium]